MERFLGAASVYIMIISGRYIKQTLSMKLRLRFVQVACLGAGWSGCDEPLEKRFVLTSGCAGEGVPVRCSDQTCSGAPKVMWRFPRPPVSEKNAKSSFSQTKNSALVPGLDF